MINPSSLISNHTRHSSKLDDLLDDDPFGSFIEFPTPPPRDDGPLRRQLSRGIRQSLQIAPVTYSGGSSSSDSDCDIDNSRLRAPSPTDSEFSMSTGSSSTYSLNDHREYRPMTPPRMSSLEFNTATSKPQKQLLSPLKLDSETRRPMSPTKQKLSHVSRSLLSFIGML
ncbi:hypothetical protein E3P99_03656 [Wallemia hederae]|uniref:Uncharacterized protein n=1 Tax=Wallemia hederae TaxID=1540922 RepID=A0A4T0FF03_9BASI|nr:hypothetical protein E3P99_03656 [Wallemia hederae]